MVQNQTLRFACHCMTGSFSEAGQGTLPSYEYYISATWSNVIPKTFTLELDMIAV